MTLVKTEPKKIIYGKPIIVSDMQGPCPDGFHVPLSSEWQAVYDILITTFRLSSNDTTMGTYLKMPMSGYRYNRNSRVNDVGSSGRYWSSTPYNVYNSYYLYFDNYGIYPQNDDYRSHGHSVRPFKNFPDIPTSSWTTLYQGSGSAGIFWNSADGLISVSGDGQNWYTIMDKNLGATTVYNQGNTLTDANCGYFYQWGNNYGFAHNGTVTTSSSQVDASNYGPGNYYNSSTFISTSYDRSSVQNDNLRGGVTQGTTEKGAVKAVYLGDTKVRPSATPITTAGIYRNETDGLISLSSNGSTRYTIADKNLGATQVYNSGDTLSEDNCGKYYQWGNNYGFPFVGAITTSSTKVDARNYGPGNYYNSSTFITGSGGWSSEPNDNLWGGITGTVEAMQGPCDSGFHVPTKDEWGSIFNILITDFNFEQNGSTLKTYLKIPICGYRRNSDGAVYQKNVYGYYRTVTIYSSGKASYTTTTHQSSAGWDQGLNHIVGSSIRPFKNGAVQPDTSRTKLY